MNRKGKDNTSGSRLRTLSIIVVLFAAIHFTVGFPRVWDSLKEQTLLLYQALPGVSVTQEPVVSVTHAPAPPTEPNFPPSDNADSYAFRNHQPDGTPLVRDACRPFTYYLDKKHMPENGEELAHGAFAEVAKHSGMTFNFGGYDVQREDTKAGKDKQNIYVAWKPNFEDSTSAPRNAAGFALITSLRDKDTGYRELTSGQIMLNRSSKPPFDTERFPEYVEPWYQQTLLHEIGHILGLEHVDDPGQVMYRVAKFRDVGFGAGDIAGLAEIGTMCD